MRMWHPDLIPLLCDEHLIRQWKEFFIIIGHLKKGNNLRIAIKNRNINIHIMVYYYLILLKEMKKRQIKIKRELTNSDVDLINKYTVDNSFKPLCLMRDIIDLSLRCNDCCLRILDELYYKNKNIFIETKAIKIILNLIDNDIFDKKNKRIYSEK